MFFSLIRFVYDLNRLKLLVHVAIWVVERTPVLHYNSMQSLANNPIYALLTCEKNPKTNTIQFKAFTFRLCNTLGCNMDVVQDWCVVLMDLVNVSRHRLLLVPLVK